VLTLTPPSLNFGNQLLAIASASQNISVQNTGNLPVTLTAVNVSGDFSIATNSCAGTLAEGVACTVGVRFTPTTTGSRTGSLSIQSSALGSPSTAGLTGVGIAGTLSVPASLNLGNQQVGTVGTPSTVAVSNTSALPVTVGVVTISPAANFIIGSNTCTGTLAGGASCAIGVQFTPTTIGHLTATLTIPSNAAANPHLVALVGDSGPAPEGNDSTVRTLSFFNPAPLGPPNPPLQSSSARATLTFFNRRRLGTAESAAAIVERRRDADLLQPGAARPPNPPCISSARALTS
jgi:hypothetical protein